ncbi:hypothetical protein ACFL7D_04485 [candidate division KSB1 bacterium]
MTVLVLSGIKRVKTIEVTRGKFIFLVLIASVLSISFLVSIGFNAYHYLKSNDILFTSVFAGDLDHKSLDGSKKPEQKIFRNVTNIGMPKKNSSGPVEIEDEEPAAEIIIDINENDKNSDLFTVKDVKEKLSEDKAELTISVRIFKEDSPMHIMSGQLVFAAKTDNIEQPFVSSHNVEFNEKGEIVKLNDSIKFSMKKGILKLVNKGDSFEYYRIMVFSINGILLSQETIPINISN